MFIIIIKMDINSFINEYIENINNIRIEQFNKFNFIYTDKIIEIKKINENIQDFKKFQINLKKKTLIEKLKPGNINKKEYSPNNEIDILEDDIFNNEFYENNTENSNKIELDNIDYNKKIELVKDFLSRKNIILEEEEFKKIEDIINNPEINIKKYINISKLYQEVTKISFIKKLENGSYIIDLNNNKHKKTKNYFIK